MAIKFFFSGSKAARTSYRSFVRSSVNMQGGTHTYAASRLKFTSPGSYIVLPLARMLFIRSVDKKRKLSELPSQNQEFLTHSVELPVHRTWQLSFSFREAKQLVHPIEVSSEVPWICKEAHTRMRASRLKFTSPGSDIVLPSSLNESNWKIETMVDSGAPVSNTLVHRLIMYSTSSILIRIWSAPLMAFGAAAKEAYLCSLC